MPPRRLGRAKHPLAVGCDHIFAVDSHPVEAGTASEYVRGRRLVGGVHQVVAVSSDELVFRSFAEWAVDQKVVAFLAYQVVGAFAADNCIVARAAHQILVASGGAAFITAEKYIFARTA